MRPLVGRTRELDRLVAALRRSAAGMRVVAVAGEPGIGKTRLLEELPALAPEWSVRVGRSSELERDTPFAPVVDAFREVEEPERRRLGDLRSDQRDRLAAILPALAGLGVAGPEGLHRYHAQHALHRMLEVLARRRPLVLAIDDLHWSDDATRELLAHLLRRPPDAPLALVLAYRPAELSRAVRAALDDAERHLQVTTIELEPLTREDARELVGPHVAGDLHDALYRESGGNPLYLEQLTTALRRRAAAPHAPADLATAPHATGGAADLPAGLDDDPRLPGVPGAVRRALAAELAALGPDARLAARAAAVLGETFAVDMVAAVAPLEPGAAAEAVDALVDADLVRPATVPLLRFRHPIVRRAISDDAPPAWRAVAHARADAALAARGASPLARAPHVERSAAPGDHQAAAVLLAAGGAAALHAPAIAARWFEAARRVGDPAEELGMLPMLGMCLGLAGRLRESREVLGTALERLPPDRRGSVAAFAAGVDHFLGHHADARALLERTLLDAPPGSADAATLVDELVWDSWFQGDWRGIGAQAGRALDAARAAHEPALEASALAFVAIGETAHGHVAQATPHLREAARIVDGLDDAQLAPRILTLFAVAVSEGLAEQFAASRRHGLRGAELARRTGQETRLVMFEAGIALACVFLGHLREAGERIAVALEIARLYGLDHLLGWTETINTLQRLSAGELDAAAIAYANAERAFATMALEPPAQQSLECAELWLELLPAAAAHERLLEVAGGPELDRLPPRYRPLACELLARVAPSAEAARAWADHADACATLLPVSGQAPVLRAHARVALRDGDRPRAAALALRAADIAAPAPLDALRSRLLAATALDGEAAIAQLTLVHRGAREHGARGLRDRSAAELRRLGARVGSPGRPPRRGSGLNALSAREHEVAQLVAERLTNREIAERLVLSPKTVERHLSRIYETLGIHSRVELARALERQRG